MGRKYRSETGVPDQAYFLYYFQRNPRFGELCPENFSGSGTQIILEYGFL
jgi:hypothetical protein